MRIESASAPPPAAGILLAAGLSTRFDAGFKLLMPFGDHPVVRASALAALTAGLRPLIVVIGHRSDEVEERLADLSLSVVHNPRHAEGLGTSLAAGIRALEADPEVTIAALSLADEPGIDPAVIARVARECSAASPAVRAVYDDRPGHPVVVHRSLFGLLGEGRTEDAGADRGVARRLADAGHEIRPIRIGGLAPVDVDRPEDYDRALREPI